MPKSIFPFLLFLFVSCSSFAQTIRLDSVDHITGIHHKNSELFIAGNNYPEDSTIGLVAKIKGDQSVQWKIVFREGNFNMVENFLVVNDTIYANLLTGTSDRRNDSFSAKRYIVVIHSSGKELKRMPIGNAWGGCSNLLWQDQKLYFTYKNASSPYRYKIVADSSIFIAVDINTGQPLFRKVSIRKYFTPDILLKKDTAFITVGNFDRYQNGRIREQLALVYQNDSLQEKVFPTTNYENFGTAFFQAGSALVLVSACTYPPDSSYIKITTTNEGSSEQRSKYIYFASHKWSWVHSKISPGKDGFWVIVQKIKDNNYYLVNISTQGKIIREIKYAFQYPQNSFNYFLNKYTVTFIFKKGNETTVVSQKLAAAFY